MAVVNPQKLVGRTKTVQAAAVTPQQQLAYSPADSAVLKDISKSLTNIIQLLSQQNKQTLRDVDQTRKSQERSRRQGIELGLERSFATVKNIAQSVVAPVKSILDQIIQYFVTIFVGRALILLLNWFADENNRSKIRSIMRFLSDWWPSLVAGYILFGTGFGRVVRKVAAVAIGATARLVVIAARLVKAIATGKGLKGMAAAFSGGGGGGKFGLVKFGLGALATIGTGVAINKFMGGDEEQAPQLDVPEAPAAPAMGAFGGGFASLKDLFSTSTSGVGSKINPFTSFFGSGGLASLMQGMNGVVSGPKGIDKVPAMLTDGEFVMSRGAVQKFGVSTLESMNAAGGGTNKPKVVQGTTYAFGGGFVGDDELYRMAANNNRGENLKEISYNPNNQEHKNTYEKIKKIAIKRGVYKPPTGAKANTYTSPNVKTNVNVNYKPTSNSSMVRSPGSGLSTNVKPPVQRINTNMNVPGGRIRGGSLSAIMAAFEMKQRKDEGQTNVQAGLGAGGSALGGQLGWMAGAKAGALAGAALGSIVPGLGTGVGAAVGAIVGGLSAGYGGAMLGGKLADDISGVNAVKERNSRGGIGGAMKGGWGLKKQEFKDAPKTSIITDDKGRPSIGYKALKNGKLHYVRGSQPGTGTTNPLEMLGRFINPDAYKDNDAKLARQKHKEAMVNSLEGFQKQGMSSDAQARMMKQMGGNLKDTQNDLNFRKKSAQIARQKPKAKGITPTPRPAPKVVSTKPRVAGGGMGGRRGGGSKPSVPQFSASSGSSRKTKNTLGIK